MDLRPLSTSLVLLALLPSVTRADQLCRRCSGWCADADLAAVGPPGDHQRRRRPPAEPTGAVRDRARPGVRRDADAAPSTMPMPIAWAPGAPARRRVPLMPARTRSLCSREVRPSISASSATRSDPRASCSRAGPPWRRARRRPAPFTHDDLLRVRLVPEPSVVTRGRTRARPTRRRGRARRDVSESSSNAGFRTCEAMYETIATPAPIAIAPAGDVAAGRCDPTRRDRRGRTAGAVGLPRWDLDERPHDDRRRGRGAGVQERERRGRLALSAAGVEAEPAGRVRRRSGETGLCGAIGSLPS